jgi:hypothetical protein
MKNMQFKRVAAGVLAAAAITGTGAIAATTAGAGEASAAVYYVGYVQGHKAFAIGPYSSAGACETRARILRDHGAKRYGSAFGVCYYKNGAWWARSPWVA